MANRTRLLNLYKPDFHETGWDDEINENFNTMDDLATGVINVTASSYNADPTGNIPSDSAFNGAINVANGAAGSLGALIVIPTGRYRITSPLNDVGSNVHFLGLGGAILSKEFNGDLFSSHGAYSKWINVNVDANGDIYTGAVIRFKQFSSGEEWVGGRVDDGADPIFLFEDVGGTLCHIHHCLLHMHDSMPVGAACVKRTISTLDSSASPRMFDHIICVGPNTWFANVNGFHGTYFDNIYSNGFTIGDNTLNGYITNCRLAVPTGRVASLSGNSISVTDCIFGGDVTIEAGFFYGCCVNNTMDPSKTFTDNSIKTGAPSTPRVEDPRLATGMQVLTLTTANLPAASASMNNRIIIEDAGAGSCKVVVYKDGERFRQDLGAAF